MKTKYLALMVLFSVNAFAKWSYVVPMQYQSAESFSEGRAVVGKNDANGSLRLGYIDLDGKIVVKGMYGRAGSFGGGYAAVAQDFYGDFTIIDKNGQAVLTTQPQSIYDGCLRRVSSIQDRFSDGLVPVNLETYGGNCSYRSEETGYMNLKGEIVYNTFGQYHARSSFVDGRAIVPTGGYGYSATKYMVVDTSFKQVGKAFEIIGDLSEGYFVIGSGDFYGFMGKDGKYLKKLVYDGAGPFKQGLAAVQEDGLWGYIDLKGQLAIAPKFTYASEFTADGLAYAEIRTADGIEVETGYIDANGNWVLKIKYSETESSSSPYHFSAENFSEGRVTVRVDGAYSFIDKTGNLISKDGFDVVAPFKDGVARVVKNGKTGYIGLDGQYLVDPIFDEGLDFIEGRAAVKSGTAWGYISITP